jgi:Glycerol-3-phosphate acyltransferase
MFTLAVVLVGSYLLGSVPFGYLAGKIRGIDIRTIGSGNVGATNVVRVLGKAYGYPVFVLDFLKGLGAVKISMWVAMLVHPDRGSPEVFGIVAAGGSVIGHCFPLWLKFKGGKGVFRVDAIGVRDRRRDMAGNLLVYSVRLAGFHDCRGCAAIRHPDFELAASQLRDCAILFFGLFGSRRHLAAS